MKLIFKNFILIIFFLLPNFAYSQSIKCQIDKPLGSTKKTYLKDWINPINNHFINNNNIITYNNMPKTSFLDKEKYVGKIIENSSNKILWQYSFKTP